MTVAKGIRAVLEQPYSPAKSVSAHRRQSSLPSITTKGGDRQRMLGRVKTIWITGVLEHSLHG